MTRIVEVMPESPLAVAGRDYIPHGPVVPIVYGGKHPAPGFSWKGDAALQSAADLSAFHAQTLNVAMRLDNFLVVDVDGEEGQRSLATLEAQIGPLPRTVTQRSGGGGLHIFFRLNGQSPSQLAVKNGEFPKIDFKAGAGHILVMAPSLHASGNRYELTGQLQDAPTIPDALLKLLIKRPAESSARAQSGFGREGERHELLVRQGVRLLNQGWEIGSITDALWQYVGTFKDPWSEEEARREINGVMDWLSGLERGLLFPSSVTPIDIADWLKPHIQGELVHLENGDWLIKRGHVYEPAGREQIKAFLVRKTCPAIKDFERWMRHLDDEKALAAAKAKLTRLKSLSWTDKTIEALAADPQLGVNVADLDPAGVLNFKNGAFTLDGKPAPEAICTKQLGVNFNPDAASSPSFDAFLRWALPAESGSTLLDIVGHALQRERSSQFFWLMEGAPSAGKSTLIEVISALLGSYAVSPDTSLLFDKTLRGGGANEDLYALRGATLAVFAEGPESVTLSSSRCKTLTGGDKISARPLYGHLTHFENKAEIVLLTNHQTRLNVDDGGLRRRIKRIHFKNHVAEGERDPRLKDKLLLEGEAIMCPSSEHLAQMAS